MLRARSLASWVLILVVAALCFPPRATRAQAVAGEEAALRQAITAGGRKAGKARHDLARWLWRERRHAEAVEVARDFLRHEPEGRLATKVRILLCQARAEGGIGAPPAKPGANGGSEGVSRPVILHQVKPVYAAAGEANAAGPVILSVLIDQDGCVQEPRVHRGVRPDLDQAAQEAVRQWVFLPARLDQEPVAVHYTLTVGLQNDPGRAEEW
jgi:TonB family protein